MCHPLIICCEWPSPSSRNIAQEVQDYLIRSLHAHCDPAQRVGGDGEMEHRRQEVATETHQETCYRSVNILWPNKVIVLSDYSNSLVVRRLPSRMIRVKN